MPKYTHLTAVQTDLAEGKITCEELVRFYLKNIENTQHLNAYVAVFEEEAILRARALDTKYRDTPHLMGALYGMVIAIKDVICYAEHAVGACSTILSGYVSPFSATAVERLLAQDAIIIGRTNCDEFAMGGTNESSNIGAVKNGLDETRSPGGSSGGSAVAVQMDTCLTALGTDTGGSVRQPAAWCGLVGFKPTYGRISRHGLLAYASSFDQIGIFSHSVSDAALLLEIMAGNDEYDATVSSRPVEAYTKPIPKSPKRIGYYPAALQEGVDADIRAKMEEFLEQLKQEGHTIVTVDFPYLDYLVPTYYILTAAEASSNLSRYDGVRYGYRSPNVTSLNETYRFSRSEGFGKEVKKRILLGTFVLSSSYNEAYYKQAQRVRRLIFERTREIFSEVDFIAIPTSPVAPFKLGQKDKNPLAMYLADIFTVQANLSGMPCISIPYGKDKQNLPIGIQLMANQFEEHELFAFAGDLI